jgi:hypothetical protein
MWCHHDGRERPENERLTGVALAVAGTVELESVISENVVSFQALGSTPTLWTRRLRDIHVNAASRGGSPPVQHYTPSTSDFSTAVSRGSP